METAKTALLFRTVDQSWDHGNEGMIAECDAELDTLSEEGWTVLNLTVHIDPIDDGEGTTFIHRVVTMTHPA